MPLSHFNPTAYDSLLADKISAVTDLLAPFAPPPPEVYESARSGYRLRAEFRVWHEGNDLNYVMYRRENPRTPVPLTHFPIGCERIQALMPALMERLKPEPILRRKLFQVEFLSTLSGDTLVSLIYHRRLDDEWRREAQDLAATLNISIVGRSRRQKVVVDRDYVMECFPIHGTDYRYHQYEQAFTQPNGELNVRMIEWACNQAAGLGDDLLELYCGNGNFTLPLSRHFGQVIATELSKTSIKAARENITANDIRNIEVIRLSAQEVTQAMNGERSFRRLAHLPRPLSDYSLRTLFVDPPRAGMDPETTRMASRFPNILYISCNPQTLATNLEQLNSSHDIIRFALFDQFPYTEHMECGLLLKARQASEKPSSEQED